MSRPSCLMARPRVQFTIRHVVLLILMCAVVLALHSADWGPSGEFGLMLEADPNDDGAYMLTLLLPDHCRVRRWTLYAVNCRSNHVHAVIAAKGDRHPDDIRDQLKAWCTRRLKELERQRRGDASASKPIRDKWWTERGSGLYINDQDGLEAVIHYVCQAQDRVSELESEFQQEHVPHQL
jgi:REP element-mobilizing transposase RayT